MQHAAKSNTCGLFFMSRATLMAPALVPIEASHDMYESISCMKENRVNAS